MNFDENDYSIVESAHDALMDKSRDDIQTHNYYIDEYQSLFNSNKKGINHIKQKALKGELRNCRFRSFCWRLFLEYIPEQESDRTIKINESRAIYDSIREKYYTDPHVILKSDDNPLSQDESSQWHRYFSDSELRARIGQDVTRTFPEIDFFQIPEIQTLMINILFYYAREHPRIEYKQGMHELLAPLLFVIHCDQQTFLHAHDIGLIVEEIRHLLNPEFIEHDAYYLFSQVMDTVESWYYNDSLQPKTDPINPEPFSAPPEHSLCSVLGVKLKMITEQILKRYDADLFNHLLQMEIAPQIFGIRWMRLLFGREFSMQDLLVIWDAIFADGISFALADYIFAAMLIVIRKLLLKSDYAQCLNHLMRYPNVPDIHYIIDLALHLRDPVNYSEPNGYSPHVMPNVPSPPKMTVITQSSQMQKSNGDHSQRPNSLTIKSPIKSITNQSSITRKGQMREMRSLTSIDMESDPKQQLDDLHIKIDYCWRHMSDQLEALQKTLSLQQQLDHEDSVMVSLAELKKVRDILKGTLKFSPESNSPIQNNN